MKHLKTVGEYTDMKKLAEDVGNLHYDALSEFLYSLTKKLGDDSVDDLERGRPKLARYLWDAANKLNEAEDQIYKARMLCKPYMEE